jgi:hypothetical protein
VFKDDSVAFDCPKCGRRSNSFASELFFLGLTRPVKSGEEVTLDGTKAIVLSVYPNGSPEKAEIAGITHLRPGSAVHSMGAVIQEVLILPPKNTTVVTLSEGKVGRDDSA